MNNLIKDNYNKTKNERFTNDIDKNFKINFDNKSTLFTRLSKEYLSWI